LALISRAARLLVAFAAAAACNVAVAAMADALGDGQRAFDRGDFAEARRQWLPPANAGEPQAELDVGALYDLGRSVPQDAATAFAWYMRAAQKGLTEAQINVAVMLDSGRGVPHDAAQAALWYARAAVRGSYRAEYNLAGLYATGDGVPHNLAAATALYQAAAESGLAAAAARLNTLERIAPSAEAAGRPLSAATPLAPSGETPPANAAEIVWSAPEQPVPVEYFVEVVAIDDKGWRDVFTAYADIPAVLAQIEPGTGAYAWRVYTVARNTLHYATSPWTPFSVQSGGSTPLPNAADQPTPG
jgi:hypothetical protein